VTAEAADLPCLLGFALVPGSTRSESELVKRGTNDRGVARNQRGYSSIACHGDGDVV
jgi:hypothetical protein